MGVTCLQRAVRALPLLRPHHLVLVLVRERSNLERRRRARVSRATGSARCGAAQSWRTCLVCTHEAIRAVRLHPAVCTCDQHAAPSSGVSTASAAAPRCVAPARTERQHEELARTAVRQLMLRLPVKHVHWPTAHGAAQRSTDRHTLLQPGAASGARRWTRERRLDVHGSTQQLRVSGRGARRRATHRRTSRPSLRIVSFVHCTPRPAPPTTASPSVDVMAPPRRGAGSGAHPATGRPAVCVRLYLH